MMKLFISGSISLKLNYIGVYIGFALAGYSMSVEQAIKKTVFLIGDAYGVDKAAQEYLHENNCQNVIIYFTGEKPRNNIGNWQTQQIPNPENITGRSCYQLKDRAMAEDCDKGLMIWNGKSKGTKANMDYMDKLGKPYLLIN